MSFVSRDPFAREEIHRQTVRPFRVNGIAAKTGCKWCGNTNAKGNLFQYRVESDGGRKSEIPGLFCSIGCMRIYHS